MKSPSNRSDERKTSVILIAIVVLFGIVFAGELTRDYRGGVLASKSSSLITLAKAAPYSQDTTPIDKEAGISAYFKANSSVSLASIRDVYRTIETETEKYIIGSVPVTGYPESEDVHVYVHVDGWFLAYYLASDPVAKIIDWKDYSNNRASISTKFENILGVVASEAGVPFPGASFYDFRYPKATHLLLVAEALDDTGNTFTIKLPSTFAYFERSWSLYNTGDYGNFSLNDEKIYDACYRCNGPFYGILSASQLLPDQTHTVSVDDLGGLAIVYQVP